MKLRVELAAEEFDITVVQRHCRRAAKEIAVVIGAA